MNLTYNYYNGDYGVHHSEFRQVMKDEMNGYGEFVLTFDISDWTTEDFMDFVALTQRDKEKFLESCTHIDLWDIDNGCTHDWEYMEGQSGTMKCSACGHYQN